MPEAEPTPPGPTSPAPAVGSLGGVVPIGNAAYAQSLGKPPAPPVDRQSSPVILNLAAHIKSAWQDAKEARQVVENEMIEALLARRGEYTTEKKALIQKQRQPEIYMMVASAKMRQIESLLRDVIIGTGAEKPWTLDPTPSPDLPPGLKEQLTGQLFMEIQQAAMMGLPLVMEAAKERARQLRTEVEPIIMEEARRRCDLMEHKMEDQLLEGGYLQALDQFITDLSTYKTAFLAGPIVRKKPQLSWGPTGEMIVEEKIKLEWERVDPFDMYPARYARNLNDGPLIRKHRLSRQDLNEMIGVEGYSDDDIRKVLDQYGDTGLREWLAIDSQKDAAEGKLTDSSSEEGLIDALQYWGSASGKMLLDWGMDPAQVPDPSKEYVIEAWVIGQYVIKASLNADPLARRPYYCTSFQKIPGSIWGNGPYELLRDCQDMCNAAARALAANLGISSGPQVAILSNRLPSDEDVTEMYPWKIWQFESDPMGGTADPIHFFQPNSNAAELMQVYERFSLLADEYTGIPRYMAGFNGGEGGAGRTASGISMMISNASKLIKQVVGAIDSDVIRPFLERLYYYNMRYGDDPDLKGDVNIIARGAGSLMAKEAAQVRMNEFLQIALTSPAVQQIIGMEGLAELLRPTVKRLDVNPDKVVPPNAVIKQRMAMMAAQQMMMQQQMAEQGQDPNAPPGQQGQQRQGSNERLQDGSATSDHFSPR